MLTSQIRTWILTALAAGALLISPSFSQTEKPVERLPEKPAQAQQPTRQSTGELQTGQEPRRRPEGRRGGGQRPGGTQPGTPRRPAAVPAPGPAGLGDVQMAGNPENLMLRITSENSEGYEDVDAIEGGSFGTDIRLDNPRGKPIDQIRLVIDYNPAFISPKSLNDAALLPYLGGEPKSTVNRNLGQIYYEATLTSPPPSLDDPILYLKWDAIKPVAYTAISFGQNRQFGITDLNWESQSVLGDPLVDGDGMVSVGVRVIPSDPDEAALMQEEPQLYLGSDERVGGVQIAILPPVDTPRVGEIFTLDIVLDNRAYSQMDGASFLIQYDHRFIELLDSDQDNWITLGPNILDGPFHQDFPFDYHMANSFYPMRGLIEYRVGTSTPGDLLGVHGTVARIVARAIRPTAGTAVQFTFSKRRGTRTTEVVYMGQDVLGDPDISNDGARGAFFPILPE